MPADDADQPALVEVFWFQIQTATYIRATYARHEWHEVRYSRGNLADATHLAEEAGLQVVPHPPETAHWVQDPDSWHVVLA